MTTCSVRCSPQRDQLTFCVKSLVDDGDDIGGGEPAADSVGARDVVEGVLGEGGQLGLAEAGGFAAASDLGDEVGLGLAELPVGRSFLVSLTDAAHDMSLFFECDWSMWVGSTVHAVGLLMR